MRRSEAFAVLAMVLLVGWFGTASAGADPVRSRADLLAARLAKDPVQVTDHVLRVLPPDSAERIRAVLAPLGVRFYVVVESPSLSFEERQRPEELISLLHDRLERDGVYLVTDPSGSGTARQFGGSLPVSDAWLTARVELPYAAGAVEHVERFVEILRSPDVSARIKERRRAPESEYRSRSDARDRAEMTAFVAGTALTGLPLIGVLAWRGRRRNVQKNRGKGGRR